MRPVTVILFIGLALCCAPQRTTACNPNPPLSPILDGYPYDRTAAMALLRDADAVVSARLKLRIDTALTAADAVRADYVFEVIEGWKAVTPYRRVIAGQWVDCRLPLQPGQVFVLYFAGERLLHAVPAEALVFELDLLGDPVWLYGAGGRLMRGGED